MDSPEPGAEPESKGLDLPPSVRQSLASAIARRGAQARTVSTQGRSSMKPPEGHIVIAGGREEIHALRGPSRVIRQLEFYKTPYGPVVRLAATIDPMEGDALSVGTVLNVSQVSGDAAISGLGRQKTLYLHFYHLSESDEEGEDLQYAFSKEIPNEEPQRREAKSILAMARETYQETPEERRSFRRAVEMAEGQFTAPETPDEPEDG